MRKPRSNVVVNRLSHAFSRESRRALLKASAPTFHFVDPHSRGRSGSPRHRYLSRHVPSTISLDSPPGKFHLNDWYCISPDKEEAFICEQCRREGNEKFMGDVIHHVGNHRIWGSLYGWMNSSALEAFGEPTSRLNKFHHKLSSSEEDADCFFVNPIVARDNAKDNRESRRRRKQHYCRNRGRLPRRSLYDVSLRRCNPIISAT